MVKVPEIRGVGEEYEGSDVHLTFPINRDQDSDRLGSSPQNLFTVKTRVATTDFGSMRTLEPCRTDRIATAQVDRYNSQIVHDFIRNSTSQNKLSERQHHQRYDMKSRHSQPQVELIDDKRSCKQQQKNRLPRANKPFRGNLQSAQTETNPQALKSNVNAETALSEYQHQPIKPPHFVMKQPNSSRGRFANSAISSMNQDDSTIITLGITSPQNHNKLISNADSNSHSIFDIITPSMVTLNNQLRSGTYSARNPSQKAQAKNDHLSAYMHRVIKTQQSNRSESGRGFQLREPLRQTQTLKPQKKRNLLLSANLDKSPKKRKKTKSSLLSSNLFSRDGEFYFCSSINKI